MDAELPEYVRRNRTQWDAWAAGYAEWAPRAWTAAAPTWGVFSVPDADLGVLPSSVDGLDVVELGCGTAYISAKLARGGARPVGIDASPAQLETARRMQARFGLDFPLHLGNAERTPFPDASFDLAVSEYGASIWCDPYRWIPEAARLLRPGGQLIFLINGVLLTLCTPEDAAPDTPASDRLERPYFGLHRLDWADGSVTFTLGYGDWIRVLRANGFEVEDLIEVQPPAGATTSFPIVTPEWARQWPCEEIWKARKRERPAPASAPCSRSPAPAQGLLEAGRRRGRFPLTLMPDSTTTTMPNGALGRLRRVCPGGRQGFLPPGLLLRPAPPLLLRSERGQPVSDASQCPVLPPHRPTRQPPHHEAPDRDGQQEGGDRADHDAGHQHVPGDVGVGR